MISESEVPNVLVMEFGMDMYTLLYLKWITNKSLLYSTGNPDQYYVSAWMGGEFRGEWIHVCVWLNPLTVHLKLSQHLLISCIAIQNKKLKNNKKRSVSPPALFFFWIVLTVQGLLRFHMNFRMGFSVSSKPSLGF